MRALSVPSRKAVTCINCILKHKLSKKQILQFIIQFLAELKSSLFQPRFSTLLHYISIQQIPKGQYRYHLVRQLNNLDAPPTLNRCNMLFVHIHICVIHCMCTHVCVEARNCRKFSFPTFQLLLLIFSKLSQKLNFPPNLNFISQVSRVTEFCHQT